VGACFHRGIGECYGACTGEEPAESYNLRVQNFLKKFEYDHQDFLIIDRGKSKGEIGVVCIEKGQYRGFGYADAEYENNQEILRDAIRFYPDNRDIHALIRLYLRKNKAKVLPL
jgi:DNA polymerase-3 subunit epsilon